MGMAQVFIGMAQVLPLHGAGPAGCWRRSPHCSRPAPLYGRRSSGGWRRSSGFLAQVSFYRWDLRRKCGFCAFQWRRTPPFFRTCARMPRYLRRTVGGPAPYRGGGFRVPRLFNAAALCSVLSASLRSVLLCGPLLCSLGVPPFCAPLLPSALFSRRPSALRHAGERGNADADFGAEGFEEGFRAGRQGGAGGVDVVDQEDVAGKVVESGRAVKSGGVVES